MKRILRELQDNLLWGLAVFLSPLCYIFYSIKSILSQSAKSTIKNGMMEYDRKWEYNSDRQETITESLLRNRPDIVEAIREFDRKHRNVVKEKKYEENE